MSAILWILCIRYCQLVTAATKRRLHMFSFAAGRTTPLILHIIKSQGYPHIFHSSWVFFIYFTIFKLNMTTETIINRLTIYIYWNEWFSYRFWNSYFLGFHTLIFPRIITQKFSFNYFHRTFPYSLWLPRYYSQLLDSQLCTKTEKNIPHASHKGAG